MANPFILGDTVRLKSGSPLMSISWIDKFFDTRRPTGLVSCVWFDSDTQEQKRMCVHWDTLVKAS